MNIFKSCKKTITYLVILSMVVAGVVPTSFVKAEEENTLEKHQRSMWSTDLFSIGKGWNTAYYRYGRDRYRTV